jgi:hypothetical protein
MLNKLLSAILIVFAVTVRAQFLPSDGGYNCYMNKVNRPDHVFMLVIALTRLNTNLMFSTIRSTSIYIIALLPTPVLQEVIAVRITMPRLIDLCC